MNIFATIFLLFLNTYGLFVENNDLLFDFSTVYETYCGNLFIHITCINT